MNQLVFSYDSGEEMVLNMGPHHPSTHGVIRFIIKTDGDAKDKSDRLVHIRNTTAAPVDISGWLLRVGGRREQKVPYGTVIKPGGQFTIVFGGHGGPERADLYPHFGYV